MKMEIKDGTKAFHAKNRKAWRKWLEKNHTKETSVWLIMYHKASDTPSVYYEDAVEEALCFGWIDSTSKKRDSESRIQFFTRRKPKSSWSKVNRERAERLIQKGQMTPSGQEMIDLAKRTGTWTAMADVENTVVPPDLKKILDKNVNAGKNFHAFPPSSKKIILAWVLNAKTPETRKKRIEQTVALAEKNIRANHYQRKK